MTSSLNQSLSFVLAQSDIFACKSFVMKDGCAVRPMVKEPFSPSEFESACSPRSRYKFGFELLVRCYEEAQREDFFYAKDSYGGYGLFFGKASPMVVTKKRDFLLPNLVALLEPIKDRDMELFEPVSIFGSTDICKKIG